MIDNRKNMTCAEFSACMTELIAAGQDIFSHPHVRQCKLHRALLEDLETIARAARQLFPDVEPSEAVWDGIQARLGLQNSPPMVSEPWPGCQVTLAIHVLEHDNGKASLIVPGKPSGQRSPYGLKVLGVTRTSARRERRR